MNVLNVVFQVLGALVVLWMLAVALVALFNVLGNALLALAQSLGVYVEKASLGTIHVVNTAGVYDRPVVVAKGGVRQAVEQPKQTQQQPKQQQPQQPKQQQQHQQQQPQQPQQAKSHSDDSMQKVWQRIQKLENELNQVRNSNPGGGQDPRTNQALDAILKKLQQLDSNMTDMHDRLNELESDQVDIDAKVQELTQGYCTNGYSTVRPDPVLPQPQPAA